MNEDLLEQYERLKQFITSVKSFSISGSTDGFVNIILADNRILISIKPSQARELGKKLIQEADKADKVEKAN